MENIDFSEFPSLESLDCSENKLISLDFPDTLNLKYLNCQINEMENLDITSFVNLRNLFCGGQQGGLNLTLTLTEEQKLTWDSTWASNNANVTLNVVSSGNAGGGITESE